MPRIKITGYIDTNDLDADQIDLSHPSGLSPKGDEDLTSSFSDGPGYHLSDLEDIQTSLEI